MAFKPVVSGHLTNGTEQSVADSTDNKADSTDSTDSTDRTDSTDSNILIFERPRAKFCYQLHVNPLYSCFEANLHPARVRVPGCEHISIKFHCNAIRKTGAMVYVVICSPVLPKSHITRFQKALN